MKGKHGTSAAMKRLAEAEAKVGELEQAAKSAKAAYATEIQGLKAELQNLQGTFNAQVKAATSATILAVREDARQQVAAAEDKAALRMRDVLRFILTHAQNIQFEGADGGAGKWSELATVSGVQFGELLALDPHVTTNRRMRRATTRSVNLNADLSRDPSLKGVGA